jgi:hypothetical protein
MSDAEYAVILVYSTSHAIRAEKVLEKQGIECRLLPVPRHLSSDCGICVRVTRREVPAVRALLEAAKVEVAGVHDL